MDIIKSRNGPEEYLPAPKNNKKYGKLSNFYKREEGSRVWHICAINQIGPECY